MTIQELIDKLNKIQNKNLKVVAVNDIGGGDYYGGKFCLDVKEAKDDNDDDYVIITLNGAYDDPDDVIFEEI